ncbi:MAG: hypothetical protein P8Y69_14825 [Gammaproteobacteria bacterium]|jgi:hypothetical protein
MQLRTLGLIVLTVAGAAVATADTRDVDSTGYAVTTNMGEEITTPEGNKVTIGTVSHASLVDHVTNEEFSQWCTGSSGEFGNVGYCTVIADNGDVLWVSYLNTEEGGNWSVIGGTGQYAGATGGGTTTDQSGRGDGQAWTFVSKGKLTTK